MKGMMGLGDRRWVARADELIEYVDQGVLTVRLGRNVDVECDDRSRVAQNLPVLWNGVPGMLGVFVVPT